MKTPNQGVETKIFRGIGLLLGYGARCGAETSGELGAKSARTRAVEASSGAKAAKWRLWVRYSDARERKFCGGGAVLGDCGGGSVGEGTIFPKFSHERAIRQTPRA